MAKKYNFIDPKIYKRVYALTPIACVDVLITHRNKFLLGKRIQKPAQKQWFVPGGRVFKNETLIQAAQRKLKEEMGIHVRAPELKFLTVQQTMFKNSALGGPIHTINIAFLLPLKSKPKIDFDKSYHSEVRWFSKAERNWHPYIKTILRTAGF